MTRILTAIYGLYAWAALVVCILLTSTLMIFVPGLKRRRQIARFAARQLFRVTAVKLTVSGVTLDETTPSVVVSNHASYLDGIILTAALPANFSFLVKREMNNFPVAGFLLRRIGTEFVERFDSRRSAADARRFIRTAGSGQSLAAFPEGTFRREAGLGLFYAGAFTAAVRGGMPVVPITVLGSRHILPADKRLPVPGALDVIVHPAIMPNEADSSRAEIVRIRDLARSRILSALREPQLDFRLSAPQE